MIKFGPHAHIWAYAFWSYLGHFLTNQAQISYGNSKYYYLSIAVEKSGVGRFFKDFLFLGPKLALKRAWPHNQL